jgi:hypothetical protein
MLEVRRGKWTAAVCNAPSLSVGSCTDPLHCPAVGCRDPAWWTPSRGCWKAHWRGWWNACWRVLRVYAFCRPLTLRVRGLPIRLSVLGHLRKVLLDSVGKGHLEDTGLPGLAGHPMVVMAVLMMMLMRQGLRLGAGRRVCQDSEGVRWQRTCGRGLLRWAEGIRRGRQARGRRRGATTGRQLAEDQVEALVPVLADL